MDADDLDMVSDSQYDIMVLQVECDRLQRVHTLENLAWLVEQDHCSSGDLSGPLTDASSLREKVSTHIILDMTHTSTYTALTCTVKNRRHECL